MNFIRLDCLQTNSLFNLRSLHSRAMYMHAICPEGRLITSEPTDYSEYTTILDLSFKLMQTNISYSAVNGLTYLKCEVQC